MSYVSRPVHPFALVFASYGDYLGSGSGRGGQRNH